MGQMVHNLGGRNLWSFYIGWGRRLGKGYIAGALVRVDKLATFKFYAILFKLPPGDLDACVIGFDTTCSTQKYVGNTVLVPVVL